MPKTRFGAETEDERGRLLLEFALSKGLAFINDDESPPTFDGSTRRSWIDTTIADPITAESIFKWRVDSEPSCSDHNSISFSMYAGKHKPKKSNRFRIKNLYPVVLRSSLTQFLTGHSPERDDLDQEVEDYVDKIVAACRKSSPKLPPSIKRHTWWTKSLEVLRSKVRHAMRKYHQARDERDRRYLRQLFKGLEAEYKWKLNFAKREDSDDICENVTADDPFGVHFDVAKNPDSRFFQLSAVNKADGTLTTTTEEAIAELLDLHFPLDEGGDSLSQAQIRQSCRIPPNTEEDPPFSSSEIDAAIHNLKSKKAPSPDGLYGDVIKEAYAINPHYFQALFNNCLAKGYFPAKWKKAQVVMFNKKNKLDTDPSAYRPICLFDALGKVLDKLITHRAYFHLQSKGLLHQNQFGFIPSRSAPDAILDLKKWIAEAGRETKHCVVVSLDVKSAFSRVWWPKVLHILQNSNCPSNLFKIISSFLDDRHVSLQYGDTSISKNYTIGCPQGSNSGPLYWLLIANEALKLEFAEDVRLLAYADDFYLFVKATGKHFIQEKVTRALEQLDLWGKSVKISFEHEKAKLIPFGKKGSTSTRRIADLQAHHCQAPPRPLRKGSETTVQESSGAHPCICGPSVVDGLRPPTSKGHQYSTSSHLTPVHWDGQQPDVPLSIYTDGSKLDGRVGAAFFVYHHNLVEEHQYRLSDHCSVFQAETVALQRAIIWKRQNAPNEDCHIFRDSMSVLMSLQNHLIKNSQVQSTRQLLDASISLHRVKAHIGVAGNEEADRAEKAATQKKEVDVHLGIPERTMKRLLKDSLLTHWQTDWDSREEGVKGLFTRNIFTKVSRIRCISNPYDIQVAKNHGLCPHYLRKFNLRDCSCRCGEDQDDTVLHYATTCPILSHLRKTIKHNSSALQVLSTQPSGRRCGLFFAMCFYTNETSFRTLTSELCLHVL
ncbi:Retrovirus-related Pol polyprotein from type-1 retrotransposable element R1 [Araneus ventricosus]|uniref:Retrovirus-related Pol polyprotein from type-1 retrotransposable element R1 n=1 Tax=Araneus ventricosus TaxID=182803 RepID=A0A4Y2IDJ8_ARAVE|nr:Retrovirus-related Pol polyprotein from type-1 retrotransposable element R1 [Araneus ventricosus]